MRTPRLGRRAWRAAIGRLAYLAGTVASTVGLTRAEERLATAARGRGYDRSIRPRLHAIQALVDAERPPEDEHSTYLRRCLEADRELDAYLQDGNGVHNALRLHAHLAEKLDNQNHARERWERVLAQEGDSPRIETAFHLLLTYRKLGRFQDAVDLLESLEPRVRSSDRVQKVERSIRRRVAMQQGAARVRRVIMEPVDGRVQTPDLHGALGQLGTPAGLRERLVPVLERCAMLTGRGVIDLRQQRHDAEFQRVLDQQWPANPPTIISCVGFGWSGSGAVSDLLRDRLRVQEPYPPPELLLFRAGWGNTPLTKVVHDVQGGTLNLADVVDALLTSVLGLAPHGIDGHRFEFARRKSALGHLQHNLDEAYRLVAACDRLVDGLAAAVSQGRASTRIVETMVSLFLQRSLCLGTLGEGGGVMLDNAVHPRAVRVLDVVPSSLVIAVTRDPRDQFASRYLARRTAMGTLEKEAGRFVDSQRQILEGFLTVLEAPSRAIRSVRFEDIVLDDSARQDLLDWVGVEPAEPTPQGDARAFRPEVSARNVGIHRDLADGGELDRILEALQPLHEAIAARSRGSATAH